MAVSSLFTLQNTATATTPAMAAVNRTPPIKPPTAALTPVLKQPQATHAYMCVGRIAKSRASIDSYILAFAEWARNMSNMLMQAHFNTICKGCRSSQLRRRRGKRQRITK